MKVCIALFSADFLTMLLMNALRVSSQFLPIVFLAAFAAAVTCVQKSSLIRAEFSAHVSPREIHRLVLAAVCLATVLSGVRSQYLIETASGRLVETVGDDHGHIQEISSLVNTVRYPAQSSFEPDKYFSFYYAPWIMAAAAYKMFHPSGFTIKDTLFLSNAIYLVFMLLALLYMAMRWLVSRRQFYWALYLIVGWSGLEGLACIIHPLQHNGGWMVPFGLHLQYSNFSILSIWVVHHFSSAICLLICGYLWLEGVQPSRARPILCACLICYALYSSVFVVIGAIPFGLIVLGSAWRKRLLELSSAVVLSAAMAFPLVWLYLRKPTEVGFLLPMRHPGVIAFDILHRWPNIHLSFWPELAVFCLLLVLQFPYIWWVVRYFRKMSHSHRLLLLTGVAFLISTYFIGFSGANNYSMRGTIIPLIVVSWVCSYYLPPLTLTPVVALLLMIGSAGPLQEILQQYTFAAYSLARPRSYMLSDGLNILRLNDNGESNVIDCEGLRPAFQKHPMIRYHLEKFCQGGMSVGGGTDQELESLGPCGAWGWQKNPDIASLPCP